VSLATIDQTTPKLSLENSARMIDVAEADMRNETHYCGGGHADAPGYLGSTFEGHEFRFR